MAAIRRNLMWAAVSVGTLTKVGAAWRRAWWWLIILATVAASLLFNLLWIDSLFPGSLDWVPVRGDRGLRYLHDHLPLPSWIPQSVDFVPAFTINQAAFGIIVAVVLWFRRIRAGALAAGAVMLFGYPLLVAAWSFLVYYALEGGLYLAARGAKALRLPMGRGPLNPPSILRDRG